jgi:hypothetical protein
MLLKGGMGRNLLLGNAAAPLLKAYANQGVIICYGSKSLPEVIDLLLELPNLTLTFFCLSFPFFLGHAAFADPLIAVPTTHAF